MLDVKMDLNSVTLRKNVAQFPDRVDAQIHAVMDYQSRKGENVMKTTAPWTDRTSNARAGLSAVTEWVPLSYHAIHLFHRVTYGVFLETRWAGKYAVILPTIQRLGPETMRMLSGLFSRIGRGGV